MALTSAVTTEFTPMLASAPLITPHDMAKYWKKKTTWFTCVLASHYCDLLYETKRLIGYFQSRTTI